MMDNTGVVVADRGLGIQLASGRWFYFSDPQPEDVSIVDIASSLSKLARFTGHTTEFYSVAQHCDLVSRLVPERLALAALLHDATEAYIGDVSRPLKHLMDELAPGMLRDLENRIHAAINQKFGIELAEADVALIKHADNVALATEKRDLMVGETTWPGMPEPLHIKIEALGPSAAHQMFMNRFISLTHWRKLER
jgi:5'-deoxynucleotidase YfbR-like HD superfamily hydrolase